MGKHIKALAVSDTHRDKSGMDRIVALYSNVDYLFHLGDVVEDAQYLKHHMPGVKVVGVRGNNDYASDWPDSESVVICGNRIVLTHGHALGVKYSYDRLFYFAQEQEAKVVLFGHTHVPHTEHMEGIWLVNPGSASMGFSGEATVAMLIIGEYGIVPKILKL